MARTDTKVVRIAIASDLHAHCEDGDPPSHLDIRDPETIPTQHPVAGLFDLIEREKLKTKTLLCPGDLGHQSSPEGIKYAWDSLQKLGKKLGSSLIVGTAGNHDIDSRYQGDDHCPEHILKGLSPSFPLPDERLCDRYWARAYVIIDSGEFRLLVLNSSAYHGRGTVEQNHGRIDKQTLADIGRELKARQKKKINIFLCHHHPQTHSELGLGESDTMRQGQLLLDLLGSNQYGSWLVIHGHKHHPKISYAAGGTDSPTIFAAGSLSSNLFLKLQTAGRNQFYILEINPSEVETFGLVGRVRCWDWSHGIGWIPASDSSGLPASFGFGFRQNTAVIAGQVVKILASSEIMNWADVVGKLPQLSFLIPKDLLSLEFELASRGFKLERDGSTPMRIGKGI